LAGNRGSAHRQPAEAHEYLAAVREGGLCAVVAANLFARKTGEAAMMVGESTPRFDAEFDGEEDR
jgi:hypothetical protein